MTDIVVLERLPLVELFRRVKLQQRVTKNGFRGMVRRHVRQGLLRIEIVEGVRWALLLEPGKQRIDDALTPEAE